MQRSLRRYLPRPSARGVFMKVSGVTSGPTVEDVQKFPAMYQNTGGTLCDVNFTVVNV